MILGIGIDTTNVHRFTDWHKKSSEQLQKIFSLDEITYCLHENKQTSAERFAARFAAREAFFKAYHAMCAQLNIENKKTLLMVQKHTTVQRNKNGVPMLMINWPALLPENIKAPNVHLSLTHTIEIATAMVLLEASQNQ
ncbi:MAG: 4'-phosphopantetheinyl transferase superfamily protein [Candidatus Dependentiae bacterium]